jgi:hypothetical protein
MEDALERRYNSGRFPANARLMCYGGAADAVSAFLRFGAYAAQAKVETISLDDIRRWRSHIFLAA